MKEGEIVFGVPDYTNGRIEGNVGRELEAVGPDALTDKEKQELINPKDETKSRELRLTNIKALAAKLHEEEVWPQTSLKLASGNKVGTE